MRIGLSFDLRNPKQWHRPWRDVYAATLDLIVEAERLGIDIIKIAEHHQFDDGYMPQPLTFLAAVAARTSRIRISTGILTTPLHSAVEIAEQAAVVDGLSGGRLELGLGIGYRLPEYELYGIDFERRFALFRERIQQLRSIWRERTTTPAPVQSEIPLWAGVQGPKTSRVAGQLGMGLLYLPDDNWEHYLQGLDEGGYGRNVARLAGSFQAMLSTNPDAVFDEFAPFIEHNRFSYAWHGVEKTDKPPPTPLSTTELRELGLVGSSGAARNQLLGGGRVLQILDASEAARQISALAKGRKVDTVYLAGAVSGQINSRAYESLELVAKKLRPLLTT